MIHYREGYRYQLAKDHQERVPEFRGFAVLHAYFQVRPDGSVWIREGYAWDGLTGAVDDRKSLRASLIHDVACQAANEGLAPFQLRSPRADSAFHRIMRENGLWPPIAWWRWFAVDRYARLVGPSRPKPILQAP